PFERGRLADCYNGRAWELVAGPGPWRALDLAMAWSRRAVALSPGDADALNTLGVGEYRAGRYVEALATLERSLAVGTGLTDGFDLFFLSMAHHRLGHREEARNGLDRGLRWLGEVHGMGERFTRELAAFRAEAQAVLAGPTDELPDDV